MSDSDLPVNELIPDVKDALRRCKAVVVSASPGSGKSTVLPLAVMEEFPEGKIIMLEPRRIAARQVAERLAYNLGERTGESVGYRMRFDTRVGPSTRLEVVTEGILTRMMIDDPTLDGVSAVIFDEFHERSLNTDEAFALVRETQEIIRPDLKILIMSATIDSDAVCKALDAPLIEGGGRLFPVETIYGPEVAEAGDCASSVARTVLRASRENDGDILAFLPGEADIRKCASLLEGALENTAVYPLYGLLPFESQREAVMPRRDGVRKVVLSTPIAETSLTIEGITAVVDSGLCRKVVHDQRNGLSRLETVRVSMDMATQRAGRAGRLCPGRCYRLWNKSEERLMAQCRTPEILEADLAPLVLDLAAFGEADPGSMAWLTPPPPENLKAAGALLNALGAVAADGTITPLGRRMNALPCHPRMASMLVRARGNAEKSLACDLAALLDEKDPISLEYNGCNINLRLTELALGRDRKGIWSRIEAGARELRRMCGAKVEDGQCDPARLLAHAYPERVAKARPEGCGRFTMAGGETVRVDVSDPMSACGWIVAPAVSTKLGGEGRVFLAASADPDALEDLIRERDVLAWDSSEGRVVARHERRIGCLLVDSRPAGNVSREEICSVIAKAAPKEGLSMFDLSNPKVENLQRRIAAVSAWHPELEIPAVDTASILGKASEWLPMFIGSASSIQSLKKIDLEEVIWSITGYENRLEIERLAPSSVVVPTGSEIRLEYRAGTDAPVLRVRLQECFGLLDTPRVDGGRLPVLMELLSPGFKPVQLTSDLRSFWSGTYFEVRKELRRRYPKHSWPDDPLAAVPVRGLPRKNNC